MGSWPRGASQLTDGYWVVDPLLVGSWPRGASQLTDGYWVVDPLLLDSCMKIVNSESSPVCTGGCVQL